MTPRVRLFADHDYPAFVRIRRLAEQRDISVATAREEDGRWDHGRYEQVRVVAVDEEDAPVGYGEIYHEPSRFDPRRYFVRLAVDPAFARCTARPFDAAPRRLDDRAARLDTLATTTAARVRRARGFSNGPLVRAGPCLRTAALPLAPRRGRRARGIASELSELRAREGEDL